MKTIHQFYLLMLLLSSLLMSCKNSNPVPTIPITTMVVYDLKVLSEKTTIKLSDLGAMNIQYIPLETSEKSVIQRIEKIISSENFFITQYSKDVNLFRFNGTFVTKIGTIGRGPNEFTVASCVGINPQNETIYLIDGWQQRFLVYSNNGKFIRTFKYPVRAAVDFKFTEGGILCYNKNTFFNIDASFILIDTVGQIIKSYPNKYHWIGNFPTLAFDCENIFYNYGTHLINKEIYCDTLYTYINRDFEPYAIIDIKKELRITPEVRSESDGIIIIQNFINPWNLFEFGDYIYYEFSLPQNGKVERLCFIGSKKKKFQALINSSQGLINDLDMGPDFLPKTTKDDNTIIGWVDAQKLKAHVASEAFKNSTPKYPEKKKELEKLAASLKDTDNPVLMLVTL
ncbi:MAG TPA: 6-bladed beta-propeller [Bacteroidales bacterium]|nr:6-bladed beta-propeller [Bacteroidales bacterium]HPR73628.1 6-bladed beta-propeller [Bacteroidales bacterium]HRW86333.1 6-bladed beta-propeller [Bacteroidales bacterium]